MCTLASNDRNFSEAFDMINCRLVPDYSDLSIIQNVIVTSVLFQNVTVKTKSDGYSRMLLHGNNEHLNILMGVPFFLNQKLMMFQHHSFQAFTATNAVLHSPLLSVTTGVTTPSCCGFPEDLNLSNVQDSSKNMNLVKTDQLSFAG